MAGTEESGSPGWSEASLFIQTTVDVARAFGAAASAISPWPSIVFPSKDDSYNSQLEKLWQEVLRVIKGFSHPPQSRSITYNPEVLTSQKHQWASLQLQYLDHRSFKDPSRLFESVVVVGLHPNCNIQALRMQLFARKSEGSGKLLNSFSAQHHSPVEPILEPQILFAYPPEKQLPLKYKDLLPFCFLAGIEVHAVERTPSMSDLNEILLGQEHLKQSDLFISFTASRIHLMKTDILGVTMMRPIQKKHLSLGRKSSLAIMIYLSGLRLTTKAPCKLYANITC